MERFGSGHRQLMALLASLAILLSSTGYSLCATSPSANILVPGCNKFGLQLLRNIGKYKPGENILISGYSISEALNMTASGASGPTATEIYDAVVGPNRSAQSVNTAAKEIRDSLREAAVTDKKVEISIANSLWFSPRQPLNADFVSNCKSVYDAMVRNVDMNSAAPLINNWVATATKGKLKQLVGQLSPSTVAVLVNAIYFKGLWQNQFQKEYTKDAPFFPSSSNSKTVKMMFQSGKLPYYEDNDSQTIALPYGVGRLRLLVMLPSKKTTAAAFLDSLTEEKLANTRKFLTDTKVDLFLPKFKVEFGVYVLNESLQNLGIRTCFTGKANFSKMCVNPGVQVSEVLHKAIMEVDEEGTVAAAATAVIMTRGSLHSAQKPIEMRVDRPFLVYIEDTKTNMILFSGLVNNPL